MPRGLSPSSDWATDDFDSRGLAWGDVDDDGDLDLAVTAWTGWHLSEVRLYLNEGGALNLGWTQEVPYAIHELAWGDPDYDGDLDLAVAGADGSFGRYTNVYRNAGGTLVTGWSELLPAEVVAWADVDGNGTDDLTIGSAGYSGELAGRFGAHLTVQQSDGTDFEPWWSAADEDYVISVAWADMDSDGDLDLAEAIFDGPVRIYENVDGSLVAGWTAPVAQYSDVAWGDWNGDGLPDLALAAQQRVRVFKNLGDGTFEPAWAEVADLPWALAWGDADGDGDLDLAVANFGSPPGAPNQVYENVNGATMKLAWTSTEAEMSVDVAWADFDGDGDLDLAFVNDHAPLRIHANGGLPLLASPPLPAEVGPVDVHVAGAAPGATLALYLGWAPGSTEVAGCPGLDVDIGSGEQAGDPVVADTDGLATFEIELPLTAVGEEVRIQVADAGRCAVGPLTRQVLSPYVSVDNASRIVEGVNLGDMAGHRLASAGDHDGDGVSEIAIAAPWGDGLGRVDVGVVYVSSPPLGTTSLSGVVKLVGEAHDDKAGFAIDGGWDMSGDGAPDILVGAPHCEEENCGPGAAYLVHGPVLANTDLGTADLVLVGNAGDGAGSSVAAVEDATGDGIADLVIGLGSVDHDTVYVVPANTTGRTGIGTVATAELRGEAFDGVGAALAGGDVNGDGVNDLLVGAPVYGDHAEGAAFLLHGPVSGAVDLSVDADATLVGAAGYELAGVRLATEDMDGDGLDDVIIGADHVIYVVSGAAVGVQAPLQADVVLNGVQTWAAADLDGDGAMDLAAGNVEYGAIGSHDGEVYVHPGPLAGVVESAQATLWIRGGMNEYAGAALDVSDDLDGDGAPELVVGAPAGESGPTAGAVHLFDGVL